MALGLLAFLLVACGPTSAASHTTTATTNPTATPTVTATIAATPTLLPARYTKIVVAHGFGSPDDLALDGQGRVIFADFGNNGVNRIAANGAVTVLARGFPEPEGIVPLADGSLIVAVQGNPGEHIDRIEHLAAQTFQSTIIHTFANNTNNPGIDSLSLDAATGDLVVADSPNGTLWRMHTDGSGAQQLASGMVRPTDALAAPDGAIYIADEYGNAVLRLSPAGALTTIAPLPDPDDLAWDVDGSLLVTALGDNTVVRLNPTTGARLATVATNLFEPQGLAVDARGDIFVSEQRANIIVEFQRG
jgi:streptogramin lyase